jgi:hypothetical protein
MKEAWIMLYDAVQGEMIRAGLRDERPYGREAPP